MKKILAIILAIVLVLSLAACGGNEAPAGSENGGEQSGEVNGNTNGDGSGAQQPSGNGTGGSDGSGSTATNPANAYASERTLNKSGAVTTVDNLNNTYYKLTSEKKLKVGYIGGSVTGGTGGTDGYSWAAATTQWLKQKFPAATITEKNVAWGGTSSFWGYFRMDEDNSGRDNLIAFAPDLVFVEFSINDAYAHLTRMQSTYYMEGIVKKLRAANPKVDIVIVFVTDKSNQGKEHEKILGHKDVAAHYGIPTINVGDALVSELKKTGNSWETYMTDIVHPNNTGYKVYADCIAAYLNGKLISSPDKSGYKDHAKPANDLVSNQMKDSQIIPAVKAKSYSSDCTPINSGAVNCPSMGEKKLFTKQGGKITVEFEGRGLGFLCDGGNGGKVKVTVAGKSVEVDVMGGNNFEYPAIENLNYGKYTAEIEIIGGSKIAFGAFVVEK